MEASWYQNRSKIDVNIEMRLFDKTLFFLRKNDDFEGSGGRSWEPKSIKNRCQNRSNFRCLLGSIFSWILVDFWRKNGGKLAPKSIQKSMSTSKWRFSRSPYKTNTCSYFLIIQGRFSKPKSPKKRSKNEVQDETHLGIDFF